MSVNAFNEDACNIMTKSPKTITSSTIASEAVKIMNEKKITNLFVVEDNKPVGVIHIHDCLDKKVA